MKWIEAEVMSSGAKRLAMINASHVAYVRPSPFEIEGECYVDLTCGQDWDMVLHDYAEVRAAMLDGTPFTSLVTEDERTE